MNPTGELRTRLARERKRSKLSQQAVADAMGAYGWTPDATAITRIENGERNIRVEEAAALCAFFGLSLDALFLDPLGAHAVSEDHLAVALIRTLNAPVVGGLSDVECLETYGDAARPLADGLRQAIRDELAAMRAPG